eukprot:TRINITY_DN6438_c0_g1_i1.p1 TRINITY_DN6438_c0_g1~~TRINITY_DN6438_c0_g1_i1.p1  ORF type:complete len:233 (+),score=24.58 TRINITY_DN6438_c0_g1_i1:124-822(+)
MQIKCEDKNQPPAEKCNSNAMWPYKVLFLLSNCAKSTNDLVCTLTAEIVRGYTPTDGGGKPLDYSLNYNITLYYLIFSGGDNFAFTQGQPISVKSTIHSANTTGTANIQSSTEELTSGTVALQGFGFELLETDGFAKRGRYLEGYHFEVSDRNFKPGNLEYAYNMRVFSTDTVLPSKISYSLYPALLQFNQQPSPPVAKDVACPICFNGNDPDLFTCKSLGLQIDTHCGVVL